MTYSPVQQMLLLAYASDTGLTTLSGDAFTDESMLRDQLTGTILPGINSETGTNWTLTWGPFVKTEPYAFKWGSGSWFPSLAYRIVNAMYVATNGNQTCVAIAGTDFRSLYDWLFEDFNVLETVAWKDIYKDTQAGDDAKVSLAMRKGLDILVAATPENGIPGAGTTLVDVLNDIKASGSELFVTGHSLGGALTDVLSLWIADQQKHGGLWPDFTVYPVAFAGPTPGEFNFETYYGTLLGNTTRVWNAVDIVPNAWNPNLLSSLQTQYNAIPGGPNGLENAAIDGAIAVGKLHGYLQVMPNVQSLPGSAFSSQIDSFACQVFFQHIFAYPDLLGVPRPASLMMPGGCPTPPPPGS